jgi:hypothetical protein
VQNADKLFYKNVIIRLNFFAYFLQKRLIKIEPTIELEKFSHIKTSRESVFAGPGTDHANGVFLMETVLVSFYALAIHTDNLAIIPQHKLLTAKSLNY